MRVTCKSSKMQHQDPQDGMNVKDKNNSMVGKYEVGHANKFGKDLDEVLSALAQLCLKAVSCGQYLVILKPDFDVEISGEPYHALMLLLNTVSGNFMARLWNKTVEAGKVSTLSDLINTCTHHFRTRRLCLGLFEDAHKQSKQEFLVSQTPVPRKISNTCIGTVVENEHACIECMKLEANPVEVVVKFEAEVYQQLKPSKCSVLDSENEDAIMHHESIHEVNFHVKESNFKNSETIDDVGCKGDNLEVMSMPKTKKEKVCEESGRNIIKPSNHLQKSEHSRSLKHQIITKKRKGVKQVGLKVNNEMICPYCKKNFPGYRAFMKHKKFEHLWGKFLCPKCGLLVYTATELINHMQETKHDQDAALVKCPACKNSLTTVEIRNHYDKCVVKTYHEKIRAQNTKEKICTKCGKVFPAVHYFEHIKVHLRAEGGSEEQTRRKLYHHCDQCTKRYAHRASLCDHIRTFHEGIKNKPPPKITVICEDCGLTFSSKAALNSHRNSKHINDEKYQCKICGQHNGNTRRLNEHMLKHQEPKFKCSYCGKMFKLKGNLEAHERDHRGEKPFLCSICTSRFSSQKSIDQHMKGVHKIAGPRGGKTGWGRAEKIKK